MEKVSRETLKDFIKAFSCAYSITLNLSRTLGLEEDPLLLQSVVGFSSGVSTMGDTCGAMNGGIIVLGKRFPDDELASSKFYALCSEYFRRLEDRVGTPNCGIVHGGKHLTNNFRRAILTGKNIKCMSILKHSSEILADLVQLVQQKNFNFIEEHNCASIERMSQYFEEQSFHCCRSTISQIDKQSKKQAEPILRTSRGFCGGIGFNGTLCGAIAGGVLCLGLNSDVDLGKSGYKDSFKIVLHGLIKSDGIFSDEKRFLPAKLFSKCKEVYQKIEEKYGGAHCEDIIGLRLDTEEGSQQYITDKKIDICRNVVRDVADTVAFLL